MIRRLFRSANDMADALTERRLEMPEKR